jgi:hypothetical protein
MHETSGHRAGPQRNSGQRRLRASQDQIQGGKGVIGRVRELRELEGGLDEASAGVGGLFLIAGEPGIGKTRLADELARRAKARAFGVHWGRCWEVGGAPAFWPWIQTFRSMLRDPRAKPGSGNREVMA